MCYLKNLACQDSLNFDDFLQEGEETCVEQSQEQKNVLIPCVHKHSKPYWSEEQQMLIRLFQMIQKNSTLIKTLHQVQKFISQSLSRPNAITFQKQALAPQLPTSILEDLNYSKVDCQSSTPQSASKDLCTQLFGNNKYKYYLQLTQDFPEVVYKERNFKLDIKLVDSSNKVTRNCNILNLCCAVSTSNAEWIHQNRAGEAFLKGKTEVQLYKGEASFSKIYARDVSRVYPQGKVNLIIYTKPSSLLYGGSNSMEALVNSQEIRPLIIPDLMIKAKKKE